MTFEKRIADLRRSMVRSVEEFVLGLERLVPHSARLGTEFEKHVLGSEIGLWLARCVVQAHVDELDASPRLDHLRRYRPDEVEHFRHQLREIDGDVVRGLQDVAELRLRLGLPPQPATSEEAEVLLWGETSRQAAARAKAWRDQFRSVNGAISDASGGDSDPGSRRRRARNGDGQQHGEREAG